MRITESQLRRIIRQEVRALREAGPDLSRYAPPPSAGSSLAPVVARARQLFRGGRPGGARPRDILAELEVMLRGPEYGALGGEGTQDAIASVVATIRAGGTAADRRLAAGLEVAAFDSDY